MQRGTLNTARGKQNFRLSMDYIFDTEQAFML